MQCLMWRNLDVEQQLQTYHVLVNIGVKPAGAIATLSLYKSADLFQHPFPTTSQQIKDKSYIHDIGITGRTMDELRKRTVEADTILSHANMHVKR